MSFWNDVATLTRFRERAGHALFRGDKGVGSPSAPIRRRDKDVRSRLMSCVRLCLYALDALSLRAAMTKLVADDGRSIVIFDRFIYDEFANLDLRSPVIRTYIRLVARFVPRPHVSFLLDADPEQAYARKPEYPIEFLRSNRAAFRTVSELIGGITAIESLPVQEVAREVLGLVGTALSRETR
ncbi:MAG TPA: hypothetical protein VMA34_08540 [Terracidiphilus sp.]|nr:hypothetical protein [Terracidiphilus sp.]